jgi:hypothetical protein
MVGWADKRESYFPSMPSMDSCASRGNQLVQVRRLALKNAPPCGQRKLVYAIQVKPALAGEAAKSPKPLPAWGR